MQVGGLRTYFLTSKDGRKPLKTDTLRALLPTESEAPRLEDKNEDEIQPKHVAEKETKTITEKKESSQINKQEGKCSSFYIFILAY